MALTEIGKYKILQELGRGAMGAVYLAADPFIARRVAIKVMRPQVEEGSERFLQEARTVGSLSHPNIVLLHDFGFLGELPYLVMEHVEGTILDRWLVEPRGAKDRLRVLAGLCRAVAYAHSRGVLHRDLKPSNVLVRSDGEAKLLDFGIALVQDTRMTAAGVVLGTPEYLAPELLGGGGFSPQSDMYSLGLVAYELFGGRNPFRADTVAACLRLVLEVEPVPLAADSAAPAEVAAAVMRCLAKNPALRPESPEHLLAAVEGALAAGLAPAPRLVMGNAPTLRMETGAARRRSLRPARWLAAAVLLAAGLGAAYWLFAPTGQPVGEEGGHNKEPAPLAEPRAGGPREPAGVRAPLDTSQKTAAPSTIPVAPPVSAPALATTSAPLTSPKFPPLPRAAESRSADPRRDASPGAAGVEARPLDPAGSTQSTEPAPTAVAAPPDRAPAPASPDLQPAPLAATAPPPAEVRPVAPRLVAISPATLRRGAAVTVRLRGERLADGWSAQIRRGGKLATQVRILRAKRIGAGELEVSLLVEEDAVLGTYSLVLASEAGETSNALSFEVEL